MQKIMVLLMGLTTLMWIGSNGPMPICQAMIKEGPEIIPLQQLGMDLCHLMREHPIDGKLTMMGIGVVEVHYQVWLMQTLV
jgi:hypothetical protein